MNERAPLFPIFLKLMDRPCLVIGADAVAAAKVKSLLDAGARVTVVAPRAIWEVERLAAGNEIQWLPREFQPADLDGAFLVIAATSDSGVNGRVFNEAKRREIICNAVDDPPNCDFYFPAIVRRGDLQIAISTAGESPALAQRLRQALEACFDESAGDWVRLVGILRRQILATQPPSEERNRLLHLLARGGLQECSQVLAQERVAQTSMQQDYLLDESLRTSESKS